jgi:uncharacterized membrane protein YdjX (TVP38/TMEM64 family)
MMDEKTGVAKNGSKWIKIGIALVVVAGIVIVARALNIKEQLENLDEFISSLGAWGPLVYILIYIGCTVAAVPGSIITIVAGAIFGSLFGVIYVSIGSTVGASLAFLVSRYFARDAIAKSLSKSEKFAKLDKLTEEQGSIIVTITRLVPIFPFNLLNYGFGLTKVPFWTYAFWSWLCMLPGTVLYVVVPDGFKQLLKTGRPPLTLIIVLAADILILTFLVRHAKKILDANKAGRGTQTDQ